MSAYFDRRSDLFQRACRGARPYLDYLATGNVRERGVWARAEVALPGLPDDARTRLDPAGRIVKVLCLSGIWCGDCVRSIPILARLAEAAGPSVDLRLVDRDAIPELRDELRVLGAMRVPMVVFLTEDFHEIAAGPSRPDLHPPSRGRPGAAVEDLGGRFAARQEFRDSRSRWRKSGTLPALVAAAASAAGDA